MYDGASESNGIYGYNYVKLEEGVGVVLEYYLAFEGAKEKYEVDLDFSMN